MHTKPHRIRTSLLTLVVTAGLAATAAAPTASAAPGPSGSAGEGAATPATVRPDGSAQPSSLNISPEQLETIVGSSSAHELGELLGALQGAAHNPAEVAQIISDLAGSLSPSQITSLKGVLGQLAETLPTGNLTGLQGTVASLLDGLGSGKLTPILNALEGNLSGATLTQLQTLISSLGSLFPSQLQSKLSELVSQLDAGQLGAVVGQLFGVLHPSELHGALGELLGGLTFNTGTVGHLAEELGTTTSALAQQLGVPSKDLPGNLSAITAPLGKEGPVLSLLDGLGGLNLGLLPHGSEPGAGGSGGSGSNGGSGSGGAGGNGASGTAANPLAGTTALNLSLSRPAVGASTSRSSAAGKVKVKIVSHRAKGATATLVVAVPANGRLTVTGPGIRSWSRQVSRAERVTVRVHLTRAGIATLARHHHRTSVKLKVAFSPVGAGASVATTKVTFT